MQQDTKDTDGKKVSIYYDGECAMCTALMCKIDASGKRQTFSPKDITKDPLPQNLSHAEAMKEIHVVDGDGKMYKNAEAILKILEQYPRWRWLVWIGRLPGIKQVLPLGYNVIAANRRWLFGRVKH